MNIVESFALVTDPKTDFVVLKSNGKHKITINKECVFSLPNAALLFPKATKDIHFIKYDNGFLIDIDLKCYSGIIDGSGAQVTYKESIHKRCKTSIEYIDGIFWCPTCNESIKESDMDER